MYLGQRYKFFSKSRSKTVITPSIIDDSIYTSHTAVFLLLSLKGFQKPLLYQQLEQKAYSKRVNRLNL